VIHIFKDESSRLTGQPGEEEMETWRAPKLTLPMNQYNSLA